MNDDTIESLRVELAEVERERDVRIGLLVDTIDRFQVRAEAAEAACAEMRAALVEWVDLIEYKTAGAFPVPDKVCAALSRTDLGRGMVLVEREVVERERDAARAEADVRSGRWCEKNRAEGRDGCGMCAWCCKWQRERADTALAACAEMRAVLEGVLSEHEARVGECNCGICYPIHALLKKGGG